MCKKKSTPLVFLNTPVTDKAKDVVGLSVYAQKLSEAIDAGAQMIAVTSPFGSGKTSLIELLRKQRIFNKIIKIPMWSQINSTEDKNDTIELHRNFVYQIANQLNPKKGTYINRRLSNNYGLLKLHTNKPILYFLTILIIVFMISIWFINEYESNVIEFFPVLENIIDTLPLILTFVSVVLGLIVISLGEIIFSSIKSEKEREIECDEIIDLYREEIVKGSIPFWCRKLIVVIEDLDRTDKSDAVIDFLKELRKYYIPEENGVFRRFRKKVIFIVTIKSEAELLDNSTKKDDVNINTQQSLYEKIFDYILNLHTINIEDYNSVLDGLLKTKREEIETILKLNKGTELINVPGMQWITRGEKVDIREIKARLNSAFLLYESLESKFSTKPSFEKCAVAAYLTTAYAKEFSETDHYAFGKLVDLYIKGEEINYEDYLPSYNQSYLDEIKTLIKAKHIDGTYHMYYYNYPKNSIIYTYDEMCIQKAILYGERSDKFQEAITNVLNAKSDIIRVTMDKVIKLGIVLPDIVFENESLYIHLLKHYESKVYEWFDNLDYSIESAEKTTNLIIKLLHYDSERKVYNSNFANKLCNIWEAKFKESSILVLRKRLCIDFSSEVLWYQKLFFNHHSLITDKEMAELSYESIIELVNVESDSFDYNAMKNLISLFPSFSVSMSKMTPQESERYNSCTTLTKKLLDNIEEIFDIDTLVMVYFDFMFKTQCIFKKYEEKILNYYYECDENETIQQNIFNRYQQLINMLDEYELSDKTAEYIDELDIFTGYSEHVAYKMFNHGYYITAMLILIELDKEPEFNLECNITAVSEAIEWFVANNDYLEKLRFSILKTNRDIILNYKVLFSSSCPSLSEVEMNTLLKLEGITEKDIFNLIHPSTVREECAKELALYFSRKYQSNSLAYEILIYISNFEAETAILCMENINFDTSIKYQDFSINKKNDIKKRFDTIYDLNTIQGVLDFMAVTKTLDSKLEQFIYEESIEDENTIKQYVSIANQSAIKSINSMTIKIFSSTSSLHSCNDAIAEKLFESQKYKRYIVGKTLYNSRFDMDKGNRFNILWQEYISIFVADGYNTTRGYMSQNLKFLSEIMDRKAYIEMPFKRRIELHRLLQDADCLDDLTSYAPTEMLEYLCKINGFKDEMAATTFVNMVERYPTLLKSDKLYEHTHEKLVSPHLKGRYTKLRKKNIH